MTEQWYTAVVVVHGDVEGFGTVPVEVYLHNIADAAGSKLDLLLAARVPYPGDLDIPGVVAERLEQLTATPGAQVLSVMTYELAMVMEVAGDRRRPIFDANYAELLGTVMACDVAVSGGEINWYSAVPHGGTDPTKVAPGRPRRRADGVLITVAAYESGRHHLRCEDGVWIPRDNFGRAVVAPTMADYEQSEAVAASLGGRTEVLAAVSVARNGAVLVNGFEATAAWNAGSIPTGLGGEELTSGELDAIETAAGSASGWYREGTTVHGVFAVVAAAVPSGAQSWAFDPLSVRPSEREHEPLTITVDGDRLRLGGAVVNAPRDPARLDLLPPLTPTPIAGQAAAVRRCSR